MSKKQFSKWIDANKDFLNQPFPSVKIDALIADKSIFQTVFFKSRSAKKKYNQLDLAIICDYANLIDNNFRAAYDLLHVEDINSRGLANPKKATPNLQHYFRTKDILEFFIKDDIKCHNVLASQLNAFTRWISIAHLLLSQGCYEGSTLISAMLLHLDVNNHYVKHLPEDKRAAYQQLEDWLSPSNNYAIMRKSMAEKAIEYPFCPMFLYSRDLTMYDGLIDNDDEDKKFDISKYLIKKDELITQILRIKEAPRQPCSPYLTNFYDEIVKKYNASLLEETPILRDKKLLTKYHQSHKNLRSSNCHDSFWRKSRPKSLHLKSVETEWGDSLPFSERSLSKLN